MSDMENLDVVLGSFLTGMTRERIRERTRC